MAHKYAVTNAGFAAIQTQLASSRAMSVPCDVIEAGTAARDARRKRILASVARRMEQKELQQGDSLLYHNINKAHFIILFRNRSALFHSSCLIERKREQACNFSGSAQWTRDIDNPYLRREKEGADTVRQYGDRSAWCCSVYVWRGGASID
ncbi:hypothetical protein F5I97DRAFT_309509 [Phlebopus sp. FC_14]|nr:hypothetical protein F5I97DRAFT_309509 [Phlebopus sp. FC_14]